MKWRDMETSEGKVGGSDLNSIQCESQRSVSLIDKADELHTWQSGTEVFPQTNRSPITWKVKVKYVSTAVEAYAAICTYSVIHIDMHSIYIYMYIYMYVPMYQVENM